MESQYTRKSPEVTLANAAVKIYETGKDGKVQPLKPGVDSVVERTLGNEVVSEGGEVTRSPEFFDPRKQGSVLTELAELKVEFTQYEETRSDEKLVETVYEIADIMFQAEKLKVYADEKNLKNGEVIGGYAQEEGYNEALQALQDTSKEYTDKLISLGVSQEVIDRLVKLKYFLRSRNGKDSQKEKLLGIELVKKLQPKDTINVTDTAKVKEGSEMPAKSYLEMLNDGESSLSDSQYLTDLINRGQAGDQNAQSEYDDLVRDETSVTTENVPNVETPGQQALALENARSEEVNSANDKAREKMEELGYAPNKIGELNSIRNPDSRQQNFWVSEEAQVDFDLLSKHFIDDYYETERDEANPFQLAVRENMSEKEKQSTREYNEKIRGEYTYHNKMIRLLKDLIESELIIKTDI